MKTEIRKLAHQLGVFAAIGASVVAHSSTASAQEARNDSRLSAAQGCRSVDGGRDRYDRECTQVRVSTALDTKGGRNISILLRSSFDESNFKGYYWRSPQAEYSELGAVLHQNADGELTGRVHGLFIDGDTSGYAFAMGGRAEKDEEGTRALFAVGPGTVAGKGSHLIVPRIGLGYLSQKDPLDGESISSSAYGVAVDAALILNRLELSGNTMLMGGVSPKVTALGENVTKEQSPTTFSWQADARVHLGRLGKTNLYVHGGIDGLFFKVNDTVMDGVEKTEIKESRSGSRNRLTLGAGIAF